MFGPIEVRGARPGDALRIEIEHVRPSAWGWTYAGGGMSTPALNAALGLADAPLSLMTWTLDEARAIATNSFGHTVPVRAFPGTIGLWPAAEDACPWTPRECGGNMDCRLLTAGSTLWLPVEVAGGMISLGDGHAAQGDGELSGTAIECMLDEVRLRVTVHSGVRLAWPRVKTIEGWATLGFAETLDRAAEVAAAEMLTLMEEEFGPSRAECLALASSRVSLRVSQMVNPRRGVHAVLTA
jgi:acetamidase/formamidase